MANPNMVTLNVYAINRTIPKGTLPRTEGIFTSRIGKVLSTRDANNKWIGTDKPSNWEKIYSQIIVQKTPMGPETDNYYDNRSVSAVISAINS